MLQDWEQHYYSAACADIFELESSTGLSFKALKNVAQMLQANVAL